ncbi:MAG: choice-of-anchor D domain-containing protein, partial [Candidatus Undinarchaeales archaeon]
TPYNANGNIFPGGDSLPLVLMPPVIELIEITPDSPLEGDMVTFNATADPGTADTISVYEWNSSIDGGALSSQRVYATPNLSVGLHNISLRVQSSEGLWSDAEFETVLISPKGDLTFTPAVADFGDVSLGANKTMNVTLANTGNDTFENLSVRSNSSFLSVSLEEDTLFPNESMSVEINLIVLQNTTGSGSFTESVHVSGILQGVNKTSSLSVTYTLPEPDLSLSPQSVDLGVVELGSTHEETFTLTNTGNTTISDIQLETNSTSLSLTQLENATLEPGENTSFTATLSVPAQLTEGNYLEDINIIWDNETTVVPISFSIEIEEPVELRIEPEEWDMGTVPTGESSTQSFKITVTQGDLTGLTGSISVSNDNLLSLDRNSITLSSGEAEFKAVLSVPSSTGDYDETIRVSVSREDSHVKTEVIDVVFKAEENIDRLISSARSRLFEVKSSLNDVQAQTTQGSKLYKEIQSNVSNAENLIASAESKIDRAEDTSPDEAKSLITQANSELAQANGMIRSLDLALSKPQQDFLERFKYIFLVAGVGVAAAAFLVAWREGWIETDGKKTESLAPKKRHSMKPHPDMFKEELKGKGKPKVPKPKKKETKSEKFRKWQEYYKNHPEEARKWKKYYKMHPEKVKEWKASMKKRPKEKEKEQGQWYRSYENRRFE